MEEPARPYRSLVHPEFRRIAGALFVSLIGSQMQNVAIDWHVWVLTRSPLALGAVGLVRVLPILVFSMGGGVVADRFDRRKVMIASEAALALVATALALFTFLGRDSLPLLYLLTALSAASVAFDNPARQALMPRLVPREDLPGALAVMLTVFQAANIGGPAIAGILIAKTTALGGGHATKGLALIYLLNAVSFLGVLATLATMKTSGAPSAEGSLEAPVASLKSGLRFVFSTPILVWSMALDFFATLFSGALSLLPIFADRVLFVGPQGYGWLRAATGVGALIGSVVMTVQPLPKKQGRALLLSVAAYGAATIVWGLSRSFPLTLLALAGTGFADTISTVIRQTIRQIVTPDDLRGRMTGVNMIFFMGGPQLGELEAGVVASLFATAALGATVSVVSGGVATLVAAAAVLFVTPVVRSYDG
jgi:MFS family permease